MTKATRRTALAMFGTAGGLLQVVGIDRFDGAPRWSCCYRNAWAM